MFPSPLGVIFSLMHQHKLPTETEIDVSFRLLSELYSLLFKSDFWKYIFSPSFRLLSELYSLLFNHKYIDNGYIIIGFRLLSELYSLLYEFREKCLAMSILVSVSSRSYILSYGLLSCLYVASCSSCFRLLSELYSLLSYTQKIFCL